MFCYVLSSARSLHLFVLSSILLSSLRFFHFPSLVVSFLLVFVPVCFFVFVSVSLCSLSGLFVLSVCVFSFRLCSFPFVCLRSVCFYLRSNLSLNFDCCFYYRLGLRLSLGFFYFILALALALALFFILS